MWAGHFPETPERLRLGIDLGRPVFRLANLAGKIRGDRQSHPDPSLENFNLFGWQLARGRHFIALQLVVDRFQQQAFLWSFQVNRASTVTTLHQPGTVVQVQPTLDLVAGMALEAVLHQQWLDLAGEEFDLLSWSQYGVGSSTRSRERQERADHAFHDESEFHEQAKS